MAKYEITTWIDWSHFNGKMNFVVEADSADSAEEQLGEYISSMKVEYLHDFEGNEFGILSANWDIELNPGPVETEFEVIECYEV